MKSESFLCFRICFCHLIRILSCRSFHFWQCVKACPLTFKMSWTFIIVQNLSFKFCESLLHICPFSRNGFAKFSISLSLSIFSFSLACRTLKMKDSLLFICARVKFMVGDTRWQQKEMSFQGLGLSFKKIDWLLYLAIALTKNIALAQCSEFSGAELCPLGAMLDWGQQL